MLPPISLHQRPTADLSIVTLTNAPDSVISHFIALHLRLGVRHVHIYLDMPECSDTLRALNSDAVTIRCCDAAFWAPFGARSAYVEARQSAVYKHAYDSCPTAWIGFCDIDEFFVPKSDFATLFAQTPAQIEMHITTTWEAVWGPGHAGFGDFTANYCRRAIWNEERRKWLTHQRPVFTTFTGNGICGHSEGKALVRSGIADCIPGIHRCFRMQGGKRKPLLFQENAINLLHYDAISYAQWIDKFLQRRKPDGKMGGQSYWRRVLTDLLYLGQGEDFRLALFQDLYCAQGDYLKWLMDGDFIRRITAD
ncbi:MAG TPA: glycosyltransferase family 2 protein [Paenirhodobacter sp.]